MSPSSSEPFELPASAVETLGDPGIKLQLHGISFSHYVERARWTLRLLGLPFDQVGAGTSQAVASGLLRRMRGSGPQGSPLMHTHAHTSPLCTVLRSTTCRCCTCPASWRCSAASGRAPAALQPPASPLLPHLAWPSTQQQGGPCGEAPFLSLTRPASSCGAAAT